MPNRLGALEYLKLLCFHMWMLILISYKGLDRTLFFCLTFEGFALLVLNFSLLGLKLAVPVTVSYTYKILLSDNINSLS